MGNEMHVLRGPLCPLWFKLFLRIQSNPVIP